MVPCQAAPALDTTISTPPKAETTASNAALHAGGSVTSHCTASALPPIFLATAFAASRSRSRIATSAPCSAIALAVAAPMPEPPPVITATWRASDFLVRLAQLGLFQRPVFDFEHVEFADRLVFADGFGIGDHGDRVLGNVGGDGGILGGSADPEHAHARHQDHARQGIQFLFLQPGSCRCCGRNSRDSGRQRHRRRRARRSPIRQACRLPAPARSSASSWCGWCDRASPRPAGYSAHSSAPFT